MSSLRADWPWSTSPGGLASNAYNGHGACHCTEGWFGPGELTVRTVFWDAETWMYPPVLLLQRDLAASMLAYRALHVR
jgi:trehalose/maltose hydrolase-like predicted phosphorylase